MSGFQFSVSSMAGKRVVVVGDVMLDEFARGDVRRISPEAPVPVLEVKSRSSAPGGAANAAANVTSLGGRASLIGLAGEDAAASDLERLLLAAHIEHALVRDASRPTTHKTRLVARGQQVVRIDHESSHDASAEVRDRLVAHARSFAQNSDACIISDYRKGVVSPELCAAIVESAQKKRMPVIVDPKRRDLTAYRGATVVTPNVHELELAANATLQTTDEIVRAGESLLPELGGAAILVTRSAEGMTLLEPGKAPLHVRATARQVFDVTGAGDTVVATLALALAAGASLADAVHVASCAAGVVVTKAGTATVTPDELTSALAAER
jgi:D-beta-D-heptose 7-phosphate kinase/D-beta-D-heptose 1-phosphate adenosyltransferase